MHITVSTENILVLIKFRIHGALRFVSHAEMLKVFQRACARGGIEIQHSQGFNPHPKLSLPLPRPVGVESDDELLCVRLNGDLNEPQIKARLSAQLPEGCELLSVSLAKTNRAVQPRSVTYIVPVQPECINDKLRARIDSLRASENLFIERQIGEKGSRLRRAPSAVEGTQDLRLKNINVRPFLESIELDGNNIIVECEITTAGSIRISEILKLLEIDAEKLTAPIRRTNVQWQEPENRRQNSEDRR